MSGSFAELIVLVGLIALVYRLLRPLQRMLETRLARIFARVSGAERPVIDITAHRKKP